MVNGTSGQRDPLVKRSLWSKEPLVKGTLWSKNLWSMGLWSKFLWSTGLWSKDPHPLLLLCVGSSITPLMILKNMYLYKCHEMSSDLVAFDARIQTLFVPY